MFSINIVFAQAPKIVNVPIPNNPTLTDIFTLENQMLVLDVNSYFMAYYISNDSGQTWNKTFTDRRSPIGYGLGKYYAYTNNFDGRLFISSTKDMVHWTTDSTNEFISFPTSLKPTIFTLNNFLFFINQDSIYMSRDSGRVWKFCMMDNIGNPNLIAGDIEYDDEQVVLSMSDFAGTYESRIFKLVNDTFMHYATYSKGLKLRNGALFSDTFGTSHSRISFDHGLNWIQTNRISNGYLVYLPSESAYYNFIETTVTRSVNGINWSDYTMEWNQKFPDRPIKEIRIGNSLIRICEKGIYRSMIPNQWVDITSQIGEFSIYNVIAFKNKLKVFTASNSTYTSYDHGATWDISSTSGWDTMYYKVNETEYIRYGKGCFQFSLNKGITWQTSTYPVDFSSDNISAITSWGDRLCLIFSDPNGNRKLGISYDRGHTIDIRPFPKEGNVLLIACSGDLIIIGGDTGYFTSKDFGQTFSHHSMIYDLYSLVTIGGNIYTDNRLDSGFYRYDTLAGKFILFSKIGFHNYATTTFIKTLGIVIGINRYSRDNGITWTNYQIPDTSSIINIFFSIEDSVKIYCPTQSGLWRLDFNPITGLFSYEQLTTEKPLLYPNPYKNGPLSIVNPNESFKRIVVFDLKGTLIKEINLKGLTDSVSINMSSLEPGLYMLMFYSDSSIISQKWIKE